MQRIETRMPIKYDITLEEVGNGIWKLNYAEEHTEKDWNDTKLLNNELFPKVSMFKDLKLDDSERKLSYSIQGPQDNIFNIIAGEFLMMTSLGQMTFKDLLGTVAVALARAEVL